MKLLLITQAVDKNDPVLGFFSGWIREFSKHADQVTVVCLRKGEHDLPPHVRVLSLGKEDGESRLKYIYRFYKYIFMERSAYDSVFIHMNQIYAVLGFLPWKMMGKKVGLWYAHGKVPFLLRVANMCIDVAFSSTQEGYGITTPKLHIVGQGIDTELFAPREDRKKYSLATAGRISPVKRIEVIIDAFKEIKKEFPEATLTIIGAPGTSDQAEYERRLKQRVRDYGMDASIIFTGPVQHDKLPRLISQCDVFINMSETKSLDKAILEALSSGTLVVSSNESFKKIIQNPIYHADTVDDLKKNVCEVFKTPDIYELREEARNMVVTRHSIQQLIQNIASYL